MELIDATVSNDYDEVKRLLESGADPDVQSELEEDLQIIIVCYKETIH